MYIISTWVCCSGNQSAVLDLIKLEVNMYVYLSKYYKTELYKCLASILCEFVENKNVLSLCSYSTMKIVIVNNSIMEMTL